MLEQLRAWLNGKREYYAGVALLAEAGGAANLLAVLKKGPTAFTIARLDSELMAACNRLKNSKDAVSVGGDISIKHIIPDGRNANSKENKTAKTEESAVNQALYESCRQQALKAYKTCMNDRAILISQVNNLSAEEVNFPHFIQQRAAMALAIVRNYKNASELFDRADYVKKHGRLADSEADASPETEYDALPDDLVYDTLNNLRKSLSKLKATQKKKPTSERIALIQQREINIKKLEARWHLLKGRS